MRLRLAPAPHPHWHRTHIAPAPAAHLLRHGSEFAPALQRPRSCTGIAPAPQLHRQSTAPVLHLHQRRHRTGTRTGTGVANRSGNTEASSTSGTHFPYSDKFPVLRNYYAYREIRVIRGKIKNTRKAGTRLERAMISAQNTCTGAFFFFFLLVNRKERAIL